MTNQHTEKKALTDKIIDKSVSIFKKSILIVVFLLLWEVLPRLQIVNSAFFPPFSEVLLAIWELLVSGELWAQVSASLKRSIVGFLLAIVIGIPLGLLIGSVPIINFLLKPVFEIMRNTAKLAILPVFILFLGIGELSKVSLIFYACLIPILLNSIVAVNTVDQLLIKSARSMSMNRFKLFMKVMLPASLPTIFVGIRIAGTSCVLALIAAEMLGAQQGLGYFITYTQSSFLVPEMYAGIVLVSLLGLTINYIIVLVERRLLKWKVDIQ